MNDLVRRFRIIDSVCGCDRPAVPVAGSARCHDCGSRFVPTGTPEWHRVSTEVPVERGSAAVLALRVRGSGVAA